METEIKVWTEPHFSGSSTGELFIPYLFQLPVTAGITWLVATSLKSHPLLCMGLLSLYFFL